MKLIIIISLLCYVICDRRQQRDDRGASYKAVAVLNTGQQQIQGVIQFVQNGITNMRRRQASSVRIRGWISGLSPGQHGFHIHQFGNLTDGCKSAGPHWNPMEQTHGSPGDSVRHHGDLGNIIADQNGDANIDIEDSRLKLEGPHSIIGRAVVVHEKQDDLGRGQGDKQEESKKTGNAGGRLKCGVIGIA